MVERRYWCCLAVDGEELVGIKLFLNILLWLWYHTSMQFNHPARTIEDPPIARLLFASTSSSWLWFFVRLYVGAVWVEAGWAKVTSAVWTGSKAGVALSGFIQGALQKTVGEHPDVQWWYAWFLENVVLPNASLWAHVVAWGELAVGIALVLGAFTGIAAFFAGFMNLNFLLAGAVSVNPVLFTLSVGLMLAWKVAGYLGCDYFVLPLLGTPWSSAPSVSSSGDRST